MSDAALLQEMNTLRENSRVMLQKSWQRVEELERQSNDLDEEIEKLERRLHTLKQQADRFHQSIASNSTSFTSRGASTRHMSLKGKGSGHYDSICYRYQSHGDAVSEDTSSKDLLRSSTSARTAMSMRHAGLAETQADRIAQEVQVRRQSVGVGILPSLRELLDDSSYSTQKGSLNSSALLGGSSGGSGRMQRRSTICGFEKSPYHAHPAAFARGYDDDVSNTRQESFASRKSIRRRDGAITEPQAPPTQEHQIHTDDSAAHLAKSIFKMNSRPSSTNVAAAEPASPKQKKEMTEMGRRLQVIEQAKDLKLEDLQHRTNFEEELATALRDDVEEQQEEIQQLQQELEEIDPPNHLMAMETQLRDQAMEILELEAQLEEFQSQTTTMQAYHMKLEERWGEWDDRLAEAEADSTQILRRWNRRKEFYEQDHAEKHSKLSFLKDTAQESVSCLDRDLGEVIQPEDSLDEVMNELESLQETLTEKEERLAALLIQRLNEKQSLIERLDRAQELQRRTSKRLGDLARLGLELETIVERGARTSSFTGTERANGFSSLYDQVDRTMDQFQAALADRTDGHAPHDDSPPKTSSDVQGLRSDERQLRGMIRAELLQLMDRLPMNDDSSSDCGLSLEEKRAKEELERLEEEVKDKEGKAGQLEKELEIIESAVTTTNHSSLHRTQQDLENEERFLNRGLRQKDESTEKLESLLKGQEGLLKLLIEELDDMRDHLEITEEEYNEPNK